MPSKRRKRNTPPVINSEFVPVPTKRKAGPGRTPTLYEYEIRGEIHRHTVPEWQVLLGLRGRNTFYNRLKAWRADPRGHPLSWVFRHAADAPIERLGVGERGEPKALSPSDAATVRALVQADLSDIMGDFK